MPGTTVGVYEGELTAGTEVSSTYEGRHVTVLETELIHPFRASGFVNKGDPVIICNAAAVAERGNAVGVALSTATALTDYIAIDTEGIFNLTVFSYDDTGAGVAIVAGDPLYIHDGSTGGVGAIGTGDATISKRRNNITQMPFGYALGALVATGTGTMAIKVHWDPIAHWLLEDEPLLFGDTPVHSMVYTGEEIDISGDRTTGGDGDYYRVLHVSSGATLGAVDRWGTISCYTTLSGAPTTATSAYGGSFSLSQDTKQVNGFLGAVMAEFKNAADACATAHCLFCRIDNDSAVGFGGAMHSFIRFEDNSSSTHCHVLFDMDTFGIGADDTEIFCTQNAWAVTHTLRINVDNVDYWVGVSNAR